MEKKKTINVDNIFSGILIVALLVYFVARYILGDDFSDSAIRTWTIGTMYAMLVLSVIISNVLKRKKGYVFWIQISAVVSIALLFLASKFMS